MDLENWLSKFNIKEMVMNDLKSYLESFKKEEIEDYEDFFDGIDVNKIVYEFHSVSYSINTWYSGGEERKYISAKVTLDYEENGFAEYIAIYGLDGQFLDDYFRMV